MMFWPLTLNPKMNPPKNKWLLEFPMLIPVYTGYNSYDEIKDQIDKFLINDPQNYDPILELDLSLISHSFCAIKILDYMKFKIDKKQMDIMEMWLEKLFLAGVDTYTKRDYEMNKILLKFEGAKLIGCKNRYEKLKNITLDRTLGLSLVDWSQVLSYKYLCEIKLENQKAITTARQLLSLDESRPSSYLFIAFSLKLFKKNQEFHDFFKKITFLFLSKDFICFFNELQELDFERLDNLRFDTRSWALERSKRNREDE